MAETELGRRLPLPYRERLRRDNGGEVEAAEDDWRLFPVWDPSDRRTAGRTANHVVRENGTLRDATPSLVTGGLIAIAENGTADLLVIGPTGDGVSLWDHVSGTLTSVRVRWE